MPDAFELMGLPAAFDIDMAELERRYRELQRAVHPDRHTAGTPGERRLMINKAIEVNEAYRTLKDDLSRGHVLLSRLGISRAEGSEPKAAPDFLMEVMELREALTEVRQKRDQRKLTDLIAVVRARAAQARDSLAQAFARPGGIEGNGAEANRAAAEKAESLLSNLKYFARFLEEAEAVEVDFEEAGLGSAELER